MSGSNLGKFLIDAAVDDIKSWMQDGAGTALTSTLVGADQALDVNVVQSALPSGAATETTLASILTEVQALSQIEDEVHASGDAGIMSLAVRNDAGTALAADGDYIPLSTDSLGRLRVAAEVNFAGDYAEDSPHTTGEVGLFMLAVRNSALASVTSADADYSQLSVDARGGVLTAYSFAEDAAHSSADVGAFVLSVRSDASGALAGASGDYAPFQSWSNGELKTVDIYNGSNLQAKQSVTTTAAPIPATALTSRKELMIQNVGNASVFIGSATVTASGATQGIEIPKGGFLRVSAGPANDVYGIVAAGTNDVIVWELS